MIEKCFRINRFSCRGVSHLPWEREAPFQTVHSVSRVLSLSNNLGNLLFAQGTTPIVLSRGVLIRFCYGQRAGGFPQDHVENLFIELCIKNVIAFL
jgi:hypothetical protein